MVDVYLSAGEASPKDVRLGNPATAPGVFLAITGNQASASAGSLTVNIAPALVGVAATGFVGVVLVQGAAAGRIFWSRLQASLGGGVTVALTGNAGTGAAGSVAVNVTIALSGVSATGAVGSPAVNTATGITGNQATGSVGGVTVSMSVPLLGASATGAVGSLTPSSTITLGGVSGTGNVGTVTSSGGTPVVVESTFEWIIRARRRERR